MIGAAGEDRRIVRCPRALDVLKRQLALRTRFELAGAINHDQLFFKKTGEPIRNLQYPYSRWRRTLTPTLKIRYRKPYCARHSSVSWDLMIGRNPLWVAKQHGHSIATMLRVYAAWTEGAIQADIEAIKRAMASSPLPIKRSATPEASTGEQSQAAFKPILPKPNSEVDTGRPPLLASGFATSHQHQRLKCSKTMGNIGGERDSNSRQYLMNSVSY